MKSRLMTYARTASMLLAAGAILCGCAFSPTTEQAAQFGKVAGDGLDAFRNAADASGEMRLHIAVDRAACTYLAGGPVRLASRPALRKSPSLAARVELLESLVGYADSLVAATDPKLTTTLERNATALASSVERFDSSVIGALTALGSPVTSSPLVGPVAKLVSTILVDVVEYEMRAKLRRIIEEMHPKVQAASRVVLMGPRPQGDQFSVPGYSLQDDQRYLAGLSQQSMRERACVLRQIRAREPGAVATYRLFLEMDAAARRYEARVALFGDRDRLTKFLDDIVAAHKALLTDEVDFNRSMANLQAILADVQAIIKASKT